MTTKGEEFEEALAALVSTVDIAGAECRFPDDADPMEDLPFRSRVSFFFSEKGFGFGSFTIVQAQDRVFIDSELMGPEKVLQYLKAFVERAIFDTDQDPDRHAEYSEEMGRWCNDQCAACLAKKAKEAEHE